MSYTTLKRAPVVRKLEYLLDYLLAVRTQSSSEEIEQRLSDRKKEFEREKNLAVGRGNPFRKNIEKTSRLAEECFKLAKTLGYIQRVNGEVYISEKGEYFLRVSNREQKVLFAKDYSRVYPHLAALVLTLAKLQSGEAVLPMMNKPLFRPEAEKIGLVCGQVTFDLTRDLTTILGMTNWYYEGVGVERRQHVYLTCTLSSDISSFREIRLHLGSGWLYVIPRQIERPLFREALWNEYLGLADGVPGSPIFYSSARERVCADLRIRDDQFDAEVFKMVEWDDEFIVVWSQGVLPYQRDSSGMLKSLPPKNESGNYIVYLKMVRRG